VRAVEPQRDAASPGFGREERNVEKLSRAVENGRQKRERNVVAERGDQILLGDRAPIA
jgi:hypothetical protein